MTHNANAIAKGTKMNGTELLNAVQRYMIDFANAKGIILADEFGTVDEFKKFVIAFTIKTIVDLGRDVSEAYDIVMGEGKYDELAEAVWNAAQ